MAFTFRQIFGIFVQTTGEINITALLKLGEPGGPTALCTLYDEKLAPNTREQQRSLYHQDKYRRHVERAFLYQEEAKKDDLSFTHGCRVGMPNLQQSNISTFCVGKS